MQCGYRYDTVRLVLEAAKSGETAEVERLLKEGADPEAKDGEGRPALYLAAWKGHLDALKLLRKHGATLDATDSPGHTTLMWAAYLHPCLA